MELSIVDNARVDALTMIFVKLKVISALAENSLYHNLTDWWWENSEAIKELELFPHE